MSHTNLLYHLVFSTKDRRPFLKPERLPDINEFVGGVLHNLKARLLRGGGAADHMHLVVSGHPSLAVADMLNAIKANSSRWIHETGLAARDFAWQESYAAFTVSKSALPRVLAYVEGQEAHHCRMTFQQELVALLKRHGIEYDERHLWR